MSRFRLFLAATLLGTTGLWLRPASVSPCSCSQDDLWGAFLSADVIFTGTMVWSADPRRHEPIRSTADPIYFHFVVDRVIKGEPAESLMVISARSGTSCGYGFTKGEEYLVYASGRNDTLYTGLCTRNATLEEAGADLEFLSGVPNGPVARVNASLEASTRDSLNDASPEVRNRALHVYVAAANPAAVDHALLAGLRDPVPQVRVTALRFWETRIRRDGAPLAPVLPLLDDPERWLRLEAIGALTGAGENADSAVAVLGRIREDPDPVIREELARVLGYLSDESPGARDILTAMWETDPVGEVRATALGSLFRERPPSDGSVERLQAALRDSSAAVRAAAASILAYPAVMDETWSGRLRVQLLGDPDPRVRFAAGLSLSMWGVDLWRRVPLESLLPVLSEAVRDTEFAVHSAAFAVLAQSGSRRAVPVLVEALDDPRVAVRWEALRALGELGPVAVVAVPRLRELETLSYGSTKAMVAGTLRKIAGE